MEKLKTKTLAEIYSRQGHLREAYEILQGVAQEDPADQEVREKLKVLGEELALSSPSVQQPPFSGKEHLKFLEEWLSNIQKRRKR